MAPADALKPKSSTQGPFVLSHGMKMSTALRLLLRGPALHWSRWKQIALMPPLAAYNSLMGGVEQLLFGRALARTNFDHPPVFILGYWRSGTTLLHNLITRDPQFTYATTYECLFPWHFLTTESIVSRFTAHLVPKSRPMDNVAASWNSPQEDEIALCIMSLASCYLWLSMSHRNDIFRRYLDFSDATEDERQLWKDSLMLLMRKITLRNNQSIVLKSPSHTYKIPYLLEMFPNAKFLYIYRNPYSVFQSSVHLRETMVRENSFGLPKHVNMQQELLDTYMQCFHNYHRDRHLIPDGNLHELRFEDLEIDPLGELQKCYEGLNLSGFERVQQIIEPDLPSIKRYKKNKFKHDPQLMRTVYEFCQEAFERFGYCSPLEEVEVVAA